MIAMEPVFAEVALKHEIFGTHGIVRLLAVAVYVKECIIIQILIILIVFLDSIGTLFLLICFFLILIFFRIGIYFFRDARINMTRERHPAVATVTSEFELAI